MTDKYKKILRFKLNENQLKRNNIPRPARNGEDGVIEQINDQYGFKKGHCKRCEKPFDTSFTNKQECDFHLERSKYYNQRQHPHGCCGKPYGSRGCRVAPSHAHKENLYLDLSGYRRTEKRPPSGDGHHGVYAIDTESVHTVRGLEVSRVTVIDMDLNVVYDHVCIPDSEIIDYNTVWSGVTEKDFEGVTKTFRELREDIFTLFSADTIIVGHGLQADLMGLKMIHDTVVDTSVLYPHERGPPRRKSLKDLTKTYLRRDIQVGDGHSSKDDALAAMELVLRKI